MGVMTTSTTKARMRTIPRVFVTEERQIVLTV